MKILVTGSRSWPNDETTIAMFDAAIQPIIFWVPHVRIIVGDCPTGLDWAAREWCGRNGKEFDMHIARWDLYGKKAGPYRNKEMVLTGPDLCIGFPKPGELNKGTLGCMEMASKADIQVIDGYQMTLESE